ncbi:hypothetical protein LCGC14_1351620 [marine sediment metagenome]|uniref:Uncharacterized protein n=1 Tax=marine sediment metagenome TaxID=412755 RepID=A0A0F9KBH1_9ZZZZ
MDNKTITIIILSLIILVISTVFIGNKIIDKYRSEGFDSGYNTATRDVIIKIVNDLQINGFIQITANNQTITLVPYTGVASDSAFPLTSTVVAVKIDGKKIVIENE